MTKCRARAGQLEPKSRLGTNFDPLEDTEVVVDGVAACGGEAWLAEGRRVHQTRVIATTSAERMRKGVVSG